MGYSVKEVIDIAVGMEDAGYKFYTKVAEMFEDKGIKDIFTYLAKEEIKHKEKFESLLPESDNMPGKFNEEYYQYLKAIGGGFIYPQKIMTLEEIIEKIKNPVDAITKAFQDEKEAILFYSEIKKLYEENKEISDILETIIEEERKHALTLWDFKESLK